MESRWTNIVTTPDMTEWLALLTRKQSFESESPLAQLRDSARQRLLEAAQRYVLRLSDVAQASGVTVPQTAVLTCDPANQPIIMTGHQPVIFHAGLAFKYHCTEQAALGTAIGVAVNIDTDEGDPGNFLYPQTDPEVKQSESRQLKLASASFCESTSLCGSVPLLPADQLEQRIESIGTELSLTTESPTHKQFQQISEDYCRLANAGVLAAEANSIVRRSRGIGSRLLELPLSAICCFPEILKLTASVLQNSESFAEAYNDSLKKYREIHRIHNQANPFPDLQSGPEGTELPFWAMNVDSQSRQPLFVRTVNGVTTLFAESKAVATVPCGEVVDALNNLLMQGFQIIPRGGLITTFLRLLLADLFVHGTGGGHYDQFATAFIRSWWKVEPSPFVIASASQFLFAERRSEIKDQQSLNMNLRDLRFNPQRHFGTGIFTDSVESQLRTLYGQKQAAVAQLKSARRTGQSAKNVGQQIQTVSDEMKATVNDVFSEQLAVLSELTARTQEAVDCRLYPWFLLPNPSTF